VWGIDRASRDETIRAGERAKKAGLKRLQEDVCREQGGMKQLRLLHLSQNKTRKKKGGRGKKEGQERPTNALTWEKKMPSYRIEESGSRTR